MAAAAASEGGGIAVEAQTFEELCISGLPLTRPAGIAEGHEGLWQRMVLHEGRTFLPLEHLAPAVDALATMADNLHASMPTPQAMLLTGPKSIGKTHVLRTFEDCIRMNNEPGDGKLTLCSYTSLWGHNSSNPRSFHERLLRDIVYELQHLKRHLDVAEALGRLARNGPGSVVDVQQLLNTDPRGVDAPGAARMALSARVREVLVEADTTDRMGLASALLRRVNVAVIACVDNVEGLFEQASFSSEGATLWHSQMKEFLSLQQPAIGLVMCESFCRGRQLFLSDGRPYPFPCHYVHIPLRSNWGQDKLQHVSLEGATWTRTSLMALIFTRSCCRANGSLSLFGRAPGEQPSAEDLDMAKRLDALFLQHWDGEDELSNTEKMSSSLELVLDKFGHTPAFLAKAASRQLRSWTPGGGWPSRNSGLTYDLCKASRCYGGVMRSFLAVLSGAKRAQLANASLLGFRSLQYVVPRDSLRTHLAGPPPQQPSTAAVEAGAAQSSAAGTLWADERINAAIDSGWLVEHGELLGLENLGIYRRYASGKVHKDIMAWLRHGEHGQKAELPILHALERATGHERVVLVQDSYVRGRGEKRDVWASDDDSQAEDMAQVPLCVAPALTAALPVEVALPVSRSWSSFARARAGRVAEPEPGWSARAQAAYDSLQQLHVSMKEYLGLRKGGFWLKEPSEAWGGALIGVSYYRIEGGGIAVRIERARVIRASQETLRNGDPHGVGAARVREAVRGLMGVDTYGEAQRRHLERRHVPVVRAVGDLIAAAIAEAVNRQTEEPTKESWKEFFDCLVDDGRLRIEDGGPMIVTTHSVPDSMRAHIEDDLGICVVDGTNLKGHWAELQPACDAVGMLLGPAGMPAASARLDVVLPPEATQGEA